MHFSKSDAISILEPLYPDFLECIELGFKAYLTHYKSFSHLHKRRTKASIVNDHIIDFAKICFEDKNNIQIIEPKGLFLVEVEGKILVRFKKLNSDLQSCNFQTKQQIDFKKQLHIPGIPPALPRLDAGYIPNKLWTDLDGMYITFPFGNQIPWNIPLGNKSQRPCTIPIHFHLQNLIELLQNVSV